MTPKGPLAARIKSAGGVLLVWITPIITGVIGLAFCGRHIFVRRLGSQVRAHRIDALAKRCSWQRGCRLEVTR